MFFCMISKDVAEQILYEYNYRLGNMDYCDEYMSNHSIDEHSHWYGHSYEYDEYDSLYTMKRKMNLQVKWKHII